MNQPGFYGMPLVGFEYFSLDHGVCHDRSLGEAHQRKHYQRHPRDMGGDMVHVGNQ